MSNRRGLSVFSIAILLGSACGIAQAASPSTWIGCTGGCPARIPDRNGATNSQVIVDILVPADVCSGGTLAGYAVYLDVLHSHVGDLRATLISPTAQNVEFLSPLADGGGACAGDDIGAKFRDGADVSFAACGSLIPAVSGVVKSSAQLSALGIGSPAGTWHISLQDESHGGDGQVKNAALIVNCNFSDDIFSSGFELN
ncbi:MAG: hypothetical protein ABI451_07535 [Dokdonella sp.]